MTHAEAQTMHAYFNDVLKAARAAQTTADKARAVALAYKVFAGIVSEGQPHGENIFRYTVRIKGMAKELIAIA